MHALWIRRTLIVSLLGFALAAGLGGCEENKKPVASKAPKGFSHYFSIGIGDSTARLQLALLPAEQQRGLMQRRDLGPDDGMIFVYPKPQRMSFWMRNTPTPLDIGFFTADGVLAERHSLLPFDETSVRSRGERMQFAVEMPAGWYAKNKLAPGARLDLGALKAAIQARGLDPAEHGLRD